MNISFVLVEPAVPENIGAAARAINTMGFNDLRLVNPADHLADEARWLAHGSVELLEQATIFQDFKSAIEDLDFVIGTTAKKRSSSHDYYSPESARQLINKKGHSISKIGIVFGREESGLKNEELLSCDIASSIPLRKSYPSINLAQSVMLYTYIFSSLELPLNKAELEENESIYKELKRNAKFILAKLNLREDSVLHNRILERIATASEDDTRLFLSFAKKFRRKFE